MAKGVHICPCCGYLVDETDNFCSMCGVKLAEEQNIQSVPEAESAAADTYTSVPSGPSNSFVYGTTHEGLAETSVLGGFNYIAMAKAAEPVPDRDAGLIVSKTGERISLYMSPFRIGKKLECVEYQIRNNPTISRHHATINKRDGRYYLTDNNSTNGTFINNQQIRMETELHEGDRILLSDEEFTFTYN